MMDKKKTGLIIGKFAPLHRGHRFLIESAMKEVGHLIVLVYDVPELTSVPVEARMGWIKKIYPKVEVINAGVGPREIGNTPGINRLHVNYAKSKLSSDTKIDFVFSSEDYGIFLAEALGAENIVVDKARLNVPMSAGKIRKDLGKYKEYLDDFVLEDVIKYDCGKL